MFKKKKVLNPVEYYYIQKHNPYFFNKKMTLSNILKAFFLKSNNMIEIKFEEFYTDADMLRDDIVKYIRNEKHQFCEAIDLNHFLIDGKRYVLNVGRGGSEDEWGYVPQTTCLYLEDE
jgi:hypothetical protein